jgi:hypothetical protein
MRGSVALDPEQVLDVADRVGAYIPGLTLVRKPSAA